MVTGPSPGTLEHGVLFYSMTGVIYDPLESTWCKCVINYRELSHCSHELRITRSARRCVYVAISASPDRHGRYMPRHLSLSLSLFLSLSARLAVPNSGYLNDALAETRVCAHVRTYTHVRMRKVHKRECTNARAKLVPSWSHLRSPFPPPTRYVFLSFLHSSPPSPPLYIRARWFPSAVELRHVEITVITRRVQKA